VAHCLSGAGDEDYGGYGEREEGDDGTGMPEGEESGGGPSHVFRGWEERLDVEY